LSRIHVLPDLLINQIAAGEVIERPASVVKELLENALDAGARRVAVDVEGGGRRRIRVVDDGEGLSEEDAILAIQRHATSKLGAGSDLGRIETLGFRGEALPAIAAVSRMCILSSRDGITGVRLEIEGGSLGRVEQTGHPKGTTVDVGDLFFNTPVRAKFLRSPATELSHISEMIASYAVTIPSVTVRLRHDGRPLIEALPAAGTGERIRQIFGPRWAEAISFRVDRGGLSAEGMILPPASNSASRKTQHLYVNGRLVRDRIVSHAIAAVCEGLFPKGRHAILFLFVSCRPDMVDVNVHPAKAEVRFRDTRSVHDLVMEAIGTAIRDRPPITPLREGGSREWDGAPRVHEATRGYLESARSATSPVHTGRGAEDTIQRRIPASQGGTQGVVALAHYRESYIVAADDEGLLLLDQHAVHERILYERILAKEEGSSQRQTLMFPATVTLPKGLEHRVDEAIGMLNDVGFRAEPFGNTTLAVREVPAILEVSDPSDMVGDLLQLILDGPEAGRPGSVTLRERIVATMACHAAIKVRTPLTPEKMNYLISELFRTASPLKCPHGRPAILRFGHEEIERGFDR
jgi:DNA mismatch repair protein MutL